MMEQINIGLADAKEKLWRKKKTDSILQQAEAALGAELERKTELKQLLRVEDKDVHKLEAFSLTNLFHTILGDKQLQLEKERQELLAARLKFDECNSTIRALEDEISQHKAALEELCGAEAEYEEMLKCKETYLLHGNGADAQRLHVLMDQLAELQVQQKELEEAIHAGETAKDALSSMISSLDSAESWGTWDMLSGGFIATAVKHSRIDEAKEFAVDVKTALARFQRELKDVKLDMDVDVNIGSFETFADYFFDNLITDWIVQSRINESMSSASAALDKVQNLVNSLESRRKDVQTNMLKVQEQLRDLVEQSQE